jgi:hypothetical protein
LKNQKSSTEETDQRARERKSGTKTKKRGKNSLIFFRFIHQLKFAPARSRVGRCGNKNDQEDPALSRRPTPKCFFFFCFFVFFFFQSLPEVRSGARFFSRARQKISTERIHSSDSFFLSPRVTAAPSEHSSWPSAAGLPAKKQHIFCHPKVIITLGIFKA